jgi:hypothetical protein
MAASSDLSLAGYQMGSPPAYEWRTIASELLGPFADSNRLSAERWKRNCDFSLVATGCDTVRQQIALARLRKEAILACPINSEPVSLFGKLAQVPRCVANFGSRSHIAKLKGF